MVSENEVVHLILALSTLVYIVWNWRTLRAMPGSRWFFSSYFAVVVGLVLTVAEGFFSSSLFNVLEHAMYAFGAVLLAVWIGCMAFRSDRQETRA